MTNCTFSDDQDSLADGPAYQPSDNLPFTVYDKATLLRCVRRFLANSVTRSMMRVLVQSATTTTLVCPSNASDRWYDPDALLHFEQGGDGSHPRDDEASVAPEAAQPVAHEAVDLYQLFELLPSGDVTAADLAAMDFSWQFSLGFIYSLTAFTSIILNLITVIVLWNGPRSQLRRYLINLSMSDLLISCFSMPVTYTEYMLGHWMFPLALCPLTRFVVTLSVVVSVATMTVIGINRHSAIMDPLKGKAKRPTKIKHWRIKEAHVIAGIWLLGVAISSPDYFMFSARPFCCNGDLYYQCRQLWSSWMAHSYTVFIYIATFVVPLSLLSYLSFRMGLKLWRRRVPGDVDANRDFSRQMHRSKAVKMLLVVVIAFIISWLPIQTFSLWSLLSSQARDSNLTVYTYFFCHWLSMAHSCINPFIYGFMSKRFRSNVRRFICRAKKSDTCASPSDLCTGYRSRPTRTAIMRRTRTSISADEQQMNDALAESTQRTETNSLVMEPTANDMADPLAEAKGSPEVEAAPAPNCCIEIGTAAERVQRNGANSGCDLRAKPNLAKQRGVTSVLVRYDGKRDRCAIVRRGSEPLRLAGSPVERAKRSLAARSVNACNEPPPPKTRLHCEAGASSELSAARLRAELEANIGANHAGPQNASSRKVAIKQDGCKFVLCEPTGEPRDPSPATSKIVVQVERAPSDV